MASLPELIRALRERISGSSSSSARGGGDDPLRVIIPNLLHAYVLPSFTDKEREITAVLKLLSHTAKNFPDVFFQGRPAAVLPVIGRIIPFFSEPAFRARHGVFFEAVTSLLSLLRMSDSEAYRQFFMDAMELLEDISAVSSSSQDLSILYKSAKVSIKCFQASFSAIADTPTLLGELPACLRPPDSPGLIVDITGYEKWQCLATWTIRMINKCLTEGTRHVCGLVRPSFVYGTCRLLCHGDKILSMACLDFGCIIAISVGVDIIPAENLIRSICYILDDSAEIPRVRNLENDSKMGKCFHVLHSAVPDDIVESTAIDVVHAFSSSILKTESNELKVALCNAYARIAKICPVHIWRPSILLKSLCSDDPCPSLVLCIKATVGLLQYEGNTDCASSDCFWDLSTRDEMLGLDSVGQKRPFQESDVTMRKRQRQNKYKGIHDDVKGRHLLMQDPQVESARDMQRLLLSFVKTLGPRKGGLHYGSETIQVTPETAIMALSKLSLAFCCYRPNSLSGVVFCQVISWIHWIFKQVDRQRRVIHSSLISRFIWKLSMAYCFLRSLSMVAVKCSKMNVRMKGTILSKIGAAHAMERYLEIFTIGLHDESEDVQAEAVISMPVIVFFSGRCMIEHCSRMLLNFEDEKGEQIRRFIPLAIGYFSCLYSVENNSILDACKLSLSCSDGRKFQTLEFLKRGFWCPKCNGAGKGKPIGVRQLSVPKDLKDVASKFKMVELQALFFKLMFEDSSHEFLLAAVAILRRILGHLTGDIISETKDMWMKCFNFLILHNSKPVREAFSREITGFIQDPTLVSLFSDGQDFFERLKNSFSSSEDEHVQETILLTVSEVMNHVDIHDQLFSKSFIFLVDHFDSCHITVQITALNLIQKSKNIHLKCGIEQFLSKFHHVREKLFEHLCISLLGRPEMTRKFAEVVLGVKIGDLINRMVPEIVPKLVLSQRTDDHSLRVMHEISRYLNTDLVPLIVNCLPKVLAFALLHEDGKELSSALQFYNLQTGSDSKEIFSAALPALLDDLVCSMIDEALDGSHRRVPQMILKVARILTDSDDLPGFLKNHFVGLLNSVDRKMLHSEDLQVQNQALNRIEDLIEMMGPQLSTYLPKIMVLIMHAIEKESLQSKGFEVLDSFIKKLTEVSPSSTKHIVPQVVAAVIPFIERYQEKPSLHLSKIAAILDELIVENSSILKQQIRELPLLPDIPLLSGVNKVIQEARGSMTLRDQLRDAVDGLNHESLNVKHMVACELSRLLSLRRDDINTLIASETFADLEVLSSLISALLKACAEESRTVVGQKLKLVCADCLGALGAIDPDKFKGLSRVAGPSSHRFKIECSDDDLIFELIHNHLARAFRAASETVVQDSAALAIQELLKVAGCQANGKRGELLWDRFSNYVKDIIAPCLTSRFQLPVVTDPACSGPIYRPSMSFRRWVFYWIRKLTANSSGSRSVIFSACRGIVRHDMQTAVYLLPYLVLNVLCHGTEEARQSITEEILSVLDGAASENCVQVIFTLLDNLGQWVDDLKQQVALSQSQQGSKQPPKSKSPSESSADSDQQLQIQCNYVTVLLSAIPKVTLAKASFRCQAYARALLYFESHVREISVFDDVDISFLMEIYSGMDEPDGLSGLGSLRKSPSLHDQLLINKKAGNWAEVLTSSEQGLAMEPTSVQKHSDVLNCFLNMCHLQSMVTHVDGLISRTPQFKKTWCMHGVQAAWRLGRWDLMEEYLIGADEEGLSGTGSDSNASFDMDLAKILQAMMRKDQFAIAERIAQCKQALLVPLAAAGMDSYVRAYPYAVKLHMLSELEDFHSVLGDESLLERSFHPDDPEFSKIIKYWDDRLKFTQASLWAREPLLAFRRLVFSLSNLGAQVGNCWLQYAKLCRSAGHYETAHRAILEAQASGAECVRIEKAKLLWSTRKSDYAIAELQQVIVNRNEESGEDGGAAKMILLYTRWVHHTGQRQKEEVIGLYSRVRELQPRWEKGYFYLAKYYDDLLMDARKRQEELHTPSSTSSVGGSGLGPVTEDKPWWTYLPEVLLYYAKGLHRGHKNLFQALPRLLTLWFEFGTLCHGEELLSNKLLKSVHTRVMGILRGCLKDLPAYQWLTVLSQLISRVCHRNEDIVRVVKLIVTSVIQAYPQQALWMMAAVSKSTVAARRDAASEIIQAAKRGFRTGTDSCNLFMQFGALIDQLIKLCFHPGQQKARTVNLATEFSSLKRMMPLGVVMPVQRALTVTLPICEVDSGDPPRLDVFADVQLATISGLADEAEILSSLQRPKKVVFIGSDGVHRPFLCKPKDDLRKDARMMEFTAMVNRLLGKFPESRRRNLYIRTFAVIPLTEDCGMVEWVPHTRGLRHILQDLYIACGKFDRMKTNPGIKRIYDHCQGKMPEDEMLLTRILPMFPPVFSKWFVATFSEPVAWFRARVAYARTAAVWSMVGHIVGLGDRHGENILFDSTTGDCVHVDFSCLFDRGLQLEKPELVPFRLTQNMVDGLGITGYEGVFLKVCEITLTVLRAHRGTLVSVLETFIHDPLVEWTKSHKSSGVEVQNPHAQRAISNIKARLEGVVVGVGAAPSLPLAVEGQARRLIAEAVSLKNLGKMYIWWMAWF
ncbi:ataxia telangiectasia-mutated and RAD3-like protein isoform X2 [Wolffia australiana]